MSEKSKRSFPSLPPEVNLVALEHDVLERWQRTKVFERSLARTADGPKWAFYEGPPTANGKPGAHHVEARAFKDLFPRFKTMKGFHVARRAGWDCHGLPVEIAVEKELGLENKQDIERYGIAEFNARCRESALRHVADFAAMTERMGYWVDLDNAYRTMDTEYIESVWWSLKQIFDKGLLVEDHRVTPYCPKDETPLSDHEVAQGYARVVDPSVYVRFPITAGRWSDRDASLLVWTTTPWTLVSNTAVAVHPDVEYVLVRSARGNVVVVAEQLRTAAVGDDAEVLDRARGADLVGTRYHRPLDLLAEAEFGELAHVVVAADFVTTESGTGLVHLAPAFGADDLAVARGNALPVVNPIGPDGRFRTEVPIVGGVFFKDADDPLIEELRARGVLWRAESYEHSYPLCWRCDTRLIYYALPSWYVRTTAIKDRLVTENERTTWHPSHIKHGRYGGWLNNNVDWALSRNRYWGTPLPLWRCTQDSTHVTCVGSLVELSELAGADLSGMDPHRPYVDDVVLPCRECGSEARRVPEVVDVWFDSGAMPFAQWGAPHRNNEEFQAAFPAQYICEAVDQTRGWFYSLMAVNTLLFDRSSYETVLCLGLILDDDGRKMSKHHGNVLDPFEVFERHGADAVRWLMLAGGSPWVDRRVGHSSLDDIVRKVLLTLWNTASFFTLYANAAGWVPGGQDVPAVRDRPVLDRWMIAELHATVRDVDTALESFDSAGAGRRLVRFIEDMSNWYVRCSRRRFWNGEPAALATLHESMHVLVRLLAPFVPFIADHLWEQLCVSVEADEVDSVHLAAWPTADHALIDEQLFSRMAMVRQIVELGRSARSASKIRVRQSLAAALVVAPGFDELSDEMLDLISAELNVLTVTAAAADIVDVTVKPNFRALGRRFGARTPAVAAAVARADAPVDGVLEVEVDGETITLAGDEYVVTETPRAGWARATDGGLSVALDTTLTDELRAAGVVRDALRYVQDSRKAMKLDVTDRVDLWWSTPSEFVADALRANAESVAQEVLASRVVEGTPEVEGVEPHVHDDLKLTVWLRRSTT